MCGKAWEIDIRGRKCPEYKLKSSFNLFSGRGVKESVLK
jgi:hypothetical protein